MRSIEQIDEAIKEIEIKASSECNDEASIHYISNGCACNHLKRLKLEKALIEISGMTSGRAISRATMRANKVLKELGE